MDLQRLKEYISVAYRMEQNVYQQETLLDELRELESRLCIPAYIKEPDVMYEEDVEDGSTAWVLGVIAAFFSVAGIFFNIWAIFTSRSAGSFFVSLFWLLFFCLLMVWAVQKFNKAREEGKQYKQYENRKNAYIQTVKAYRKAKKEDEKRLRYEEHQLEYIKKQRTNILQKYSESKQVLEQLYSVNIIYPKYRSFVAMSSFYDYFMAGICTELGGPHGAYNKFDMEASMHRIVASLDDIKSALYDIRNGQRMLYHALCDIRSTNNRIISSIDSMKMQYAQTASQLEHMNRHLAEANDLERQNYRMLESKLKAIEKNSEVNAQNMKLLQEEVSFKNYMQHNVRHQW